MSLQQLNESPPTFLSSEEMEINVFIFIFFFFKGIPQNSENRA